MTFQHRPVSLYICYYDVDEPLVRSQVIPYLTELAVRGVEVHLLTFQTKRLTSQSRRAIRSELRAMGLSWHSLRYHRRFSLPATVYDICIGSVVAAAICHRYRASVVHARSHVAAVMALMIKWLSGRRFIFDVRGLLAEEYADAGHWSRESAKYKLTRRMERVLFRKADALVMLTDRIKKELISSEPGLHNRAEDIQVIPCCVDTDKYALESSEVARYRRSRKWDDRIVLAYAGKLGGWYLNEEMARFFAEAHRIEPRMFFQVLTQSQPAGLKSLLEEQGLPPEAYDIRFETPERLPLVLAASDAGISFILKSYSKIASSPTKFGEYLAAGLPVIANAGIGDCDQMIHEGRLGVLIQGFSTAELRHGARDLIVLMKDPSIRERCRQFAMDRLSLSRIGGPLYASVYRCLAEPKIQAPVSCADAVE